MSSWIKNNWTSRNLFVRVKVKKFRKDHEPPYGTLYLGRWLGTSLNWSALPGSYGKTYSKYSLSCYPPPSRPCVSQAHMQIGESHKRLWQQRIEICKILNERYWWNVMMMFQNTCVTSTNCRMWPLMPNEHSQPNQT